MARPKEFEPLEALDKAMQAFWLKGYHDTSIRDLVERTGVNYYGLYGEFDSKHGLYLAALDRYRDTVTREVVRELKKPGPALPAIQRAFNRLLALLKTPDGRVGCLICNAAVELAPSDEEVATKVRAHMKLLRNAFRAKLSEEPPGKGAAGDSDIGATAEFLTTTAYGLGLLLRFGCSDDYIRRHVRTALSVLR